MRYNFQYKSTAQSETTATIPRSDISGKQVVCECTQALDMFTVAHFKDDNFSEAGWGVFFVCCMGSQVGNQKRPSYFTKKSQFAEQGENEDNQLWLHTHIRVCIYTFYIYISLIHVRYKYLYKVCKMYVYIVLMAALQRAVVFQGLLLSELLWLSKYQCRGPHCDLTELHQMGMSIYTINYLLSFISELFQATSLAVQDNSLAHISQGLSLKLIFTKSEGHESPQ